MHELRVATGDGQMVERCWFMVSYWDCHLIGALSVLKMLIEHVVLDVFGAPKSSLPDILG